MNNEYLITFFHTKGLYIVLEKYLYQFFSAKKVNKNIDSSD